MTHTDEIARQLAKAEEEARARYERTGSEDAKKDAEFVAAFLRTIKED